MNMKLIFVFYGLVASVVSLKLENSPEDENGGTLYLSEYRIQKILGYVLYFS